MEEFLGLNIDTDLNKYFKEWIENIKDPKGSKAATAMILPRLGQDTGNEEANKILKEIESRKDYLIKNQFGYLVEMDGLMILDLVV